VKNQRRVSVLLRSALIVALAGCAFSATPTTTNQFVAQDLPDAQKYQILYSFQGEPDQASPQAGLTVLSGFLYGTTASGGTYNDGTVFRLRPTGGQKALLYSFKGGNDGANPVANLLAVDGKLFGTTQSGGADGEGTVFRIDPNGKEMVLHSFGNQLDGAQPMAGLALSRGVMYGTTYAGGVLNYGTVFRITRGGAERVLHSFLSGYSFATDGGHPVASLTAIAGLLYGTTPTGGKNAAGILFTISAKGVEKILYDFNGSLPNARGPRAPLLLFNGTFYGTAGGGANDYGAVYSIQPDGTNETLLHSFGSGSFDGRNPAAGLTALNGKLYGTTADGGANGAGTIYRLTQGSIETVLHSFGTGPPHDGSNPEAGLTLVKNALYGTTAGGGTAGQGTVFAFRP
jgi:uncharacterized repeat protein (TIGR03803 family)